MADNEPFAAESNNEDNNEMAPVSEASKAQSSEEAQESTERLMIHKIVNEDFKSYAGIQALGPFHKVYFIIWYLLFTFSSLLGIQLHDRNVTKIFHHYNRMSFIEFFFNRWTEWKWEI